MKSLKKMAKKSLILVLCLMLLISLAGCGNEKEDEPGDREIKEESASTEASAVNLSIMWWGSDVRHEATMEALDLYMDKNADISFTPEYTGWDGYWNKLPVLAASDTMPDILQMDVQFLDNYVQNNKLADLSSIDLEGIIDSETLDNLKVDGKLYAIPLALNGAGIAYNKTELEKYGITLPREGWTWDDLYAFIDEAKEKLPEGKYPMFDLSENYELYQFYQVAMGGGPVIDGDVLDLDKDLFFDMMKRMDEYRKEGKVPTTEETISFMENDPQLDAMASGKVMMCPKTVASVGVLDSLMPDTEIGIVNWPLGPEAGGWAQSTIYFCVSANSPYIEEAKEFIRWFISDSQAGECLMTVRGLPIDENVYHEIETKLQTSDIMGKELYEVASNNKPRKFYPSSAQYAEFIARPTGTYKSVMEQYMFGSITLEEAYSKLMEAGKNVSE